MRNIQELTTWPEFHNAVAAGLRLAPLQVCVVYLSVFFNFASVRCYKRMHDIVSHDLTMYLFSCSKYPFFIRAQLTQLYFFLNIGAGKGLQNVD